MEPNLEEDPDNEAADPTTTTTTEAKAATLVVAATTIIEATAVTTASTTTTTEANPLQNPKYVLTTSNTDRKLGHAKRVVRCGHSIKQKVRPTSSIRQ